MIGSVKATEAVVISEPTRVAIANLLPQKGSPELQVRSGSSRELA